MRFTLESLAGKRTVIGSWCMILAGIAVAIGALLTVVGECVQGTLDLQACLDRIPSAAIGVAVAGQGLTQLGIRFAKQVRLTHWRLQNWRLVVLHLVLLVPVTIAMLAIGV